MKRLMMSLILAVTLSLTLSTPAFAGEPPDAAKKGLGRAITQDEGNEHTYGSMIQGFIAPWYYGHSPNGYAIGPIVAYYKILAWLLY